MVIGNPVILEQSHAHNVPDLWDRGSMFTAYPILIIVDIAFFSYNSTNTIYTIDGKVSAGK